MKNIIVYKSVKYIVTYIIMFNHNLLLIIIIMVKLTANIIFSNYSLQTYTYQWMCIQKGIVIDYKLICY